MGEGMVCVTRMSWLPIPISMPWERRAGPGPYGDRPFIIIKTGY
jgi:hypothetical protein